MAPFGRILLLYQGKAPCFAPVFPLCLPAAAIHPFLPIAVTFSACVSHCTKCASPKSIYQLYQTTNTPLLPNASQPIPSTSGGSFSPHSKQKEPSANNARLPADDWPQSAGSHQRIDRSFLLFVRRSLCRFRGRACSASTQKPWKEPVCLLVYSGLFWYASPLLLTTHIERGSDAATGKMAFGR